MFGRVGSIYIPQQDIHNIIDYLKTTINIDSLFHNPL